MTIVGDIVEIADNRSIPRSGDEDANRSIPRSEVGDVGEANVDTPDMADMADMEEERSPTPGGSWSPEGDMIVFRTSGCLLEINCQLISSAGREPLLKKQLLLQ